MYSLINFNNHTCQCNYHTDMEYFHLYSFQHPFQFQPHPLLYCCSQEAITFWFLSSTSNSINITHLSLPTTVYEIHWFCYIISGSFFYCWVLLHCTNMCNLYFYSLAMEKFPPIFGYYKWTTMNILEQVLWACIFISLE